MGLHRCTECRKWFTPAVTAKQHQRVCGKECRGRRRAKLARSRRAATREDCRADERERQRKHREAAASGACHEPALSGKSSEWLGKMQQVVDKVVRLSRASFEREIRRIVRESAKVLGADVDRARACHEPASALAAAQNGSRSRLGVDGVTDQHGP
jgi:hypothetical protein